MALFSTNARCLYIALFIVIVLVVGIGQMAFISPTRALAHIDTDNEVELSQLRTDNSGLKEKEEVYKQEINTMKEDIAKITSEKDKITEEKELLQQKMEQLVVDPPKEGDPLLDMLNAPQNVLTNKDTLVYLLNNFNTYGEIRNEKKFKLDADFIPIVIR
jgi:hypothetical protein